MSAGIMSALPTGSHTRTLALTLALILPHRLSRWLAGSHIGSHTALTPARVSAVRVSVIRNISCGYTFASSQRLRSLLIASSIADLSVSI